MECDSVVSNPGRMVRDCTEPGGRESVAPEMESPVSTVRDWVSPVPERKVRGMVVRDKAVRDRVPVPGRMHIRRNCRMPKLLQKSTFS